jgi:hypothetical protein
MPAATSAVTSSISRSSPKSSAAHRSAMKRTHGDPYSSPAAPPPSPHTPAFAARSPPVFLRDLSGLLHGRFQILPAIADDQSQPVVPLETRAQPGKQPRLHRLHLRLFDREAASSSASRARAAMTFSVRGAKGLRHLRGRGQQLPFKQ